MKETQAIEDGDWRVRAIMRANCSFNDEFYPLQGYGIRVVPYKSQHPDHLTIIECYLLKNQIKSISDAYFEGKNKINEFTDQIAILINDRVEIVEWLSACPFRVSLGIPFEMLLPQPINKNKNSFKIKSSDLSYLSTISSNTNYLEAIRQTREGLCSLSEESKILFYFSALERIAEFHASERILMECSNCGFTNDRGIATANYIQNELDKYGISKKDFKIIRQLRGKIAHGAGKRDVKFAKEVAKYLPSFESATLSVISEKMNIDVKAVNKVFASDHFIIITGKKITERKWKIPPVFVVMDYGQHISLSISRTRGKGLEDRDENGLFGQEVLLNGSPPSIHRECWPD